MVNDMEDHANINVKKLINRTEIITHKHETNKKNDLKLDIERLMLRCTIRGNDNNANSTNKVKQHNNKMRNTTLHIKLHKITKIKPFAREGLRR